MADDVVGDGLEHGVEHVELADWETQPARQQTELLVDRARVLDRVTIAGAEAGLNRLGREPGVGGDGLFANADDAVKCLFAMLVQKFSGESASNLASKSAEVICVEL